MKNLKNLLPSLAALGPGLFTAYYFPDSDAHPAAVRPYFAIILLVVLAVTLVLFAVGVVIPSLKEQYERKAPFYAGVLLFLSILNILTVKTAVLPVLYFPSLDRVFGVLVEDAPFIGKLLSLLPAASASWLVWRGRCRYSDRDRHWF